MNIPTPDEFAKQHGYNPFPPKWDAWLNATREAILSAQPQAGRHVSVDEHPGKGTVINVERRPVAAGAGEGTGACCIGESCSITTEAACIEAGGTYQGDGTDCDPNPCEGGGEDTGACCYNDGSCDEGLTSTECSDNGGDWQGADTTCEEAECFNCNASDLQACFEVSVSCVSFDEEGCPCKFDMSWTDSCCFDPPSASCGNSEIEPAGDCDECDPLHPIASNGLQGFTFVQDGVCMVRIIMQFVPECFEVGEIGCTDPGITFQQDYPFTDGGAEISDTISGTVSDCTFSASVTWGPG